MNVYPHLADIHIGTWLTFNAIGILLYLILREAINIISKLENNVSYSCFGTFKNVWPRTANLYRFLYRNLCSKFKLSSVL